MACTFQSKVSPKIPPPRPAILDCSEWRCRRCSKLLGVRRKGQLHIAIQGHDYLVSLPAEAVCKNCGCFNRTDLERAR